MGHQISRRTLIGGSVAAGAVLLGGLPGEAEAAARSKPDTPIRTRSGLVTGVAAALDGITVYKGLPYAATTAGKNRWRAPQPAPS